MKISINTMGIQIFLLVLHFGFEIILPIWLLFLPSIIFILIIPIYILIILLTWWVQ